MSDQSSANPTTSTADPQLALANRQALRRQLFATAQHAFLGNSGFCDRPPEFIVSRALTHVDEAVDVIIAREEQ